MRNIFLEEKPPQWIGFVETEEKETKRQKQKNNSNNDIYEETKTKTPRC